MLKTILQDLLEPEGLTLLEGWARDGLTEKEIAEVLGISHRTLTRWKQSHPELAGALRQGKEAVDYKVESALLQNALNGNTSAQQFWLRNRRPDRWKEKPEPKKDPETGGVVILTPVMPPTAPPDNDA